ncbi:MAG: crotonase [Gammaproteobacteria bacterium]|nr:crotonase [Gammaproteobacteria bacterium]|tara:strand:+ start:368 stop:1132 length:765 start_codon:yes stop_codon:yes gene_type:complete
MIIVSDDGHVRTITLNRPDAMNAFNGELFDALTEALLEAGADQNVRVAVLTGAGKAFSTGLDLSEVGQDLPEPKHGVPGLFNSLVDFPKPLLLAINGFAVGFGATAIGFADLSIMGSSARLRCPFTSMGVVGEGASTFTFPRIMGPQWANWILYSSAWMDAEQCKKAGLVFDVVDDNLLLEEVERRAQLIAANSPTALMKSKELLMGPLRERYREAIKNEGLVYDELMGGPENMEAINAFLEKREPNFSSLSQG